MSSRSKEGPKQVDVDDALSDLMDAGIVRMGWDEELQDFVFWMPKQKKSADCADCAEEVTE